MWTRWLCCIFAQRHAGGDHGILAARHALYTCASELNPACWSGKTRNWAPVGALALNPESDSIIGCMNEATTILTCVDTSSDGAVGSVDVSFASANGVKKPSIEARDDGHTGVWHRRATKSGVFLTPFPSGCPPEGPSTVLQSLTGAYPSFVLRLLADPSRGQRTGKAYVNRA